MGKILRSSQCHTWEIRFLSSNKSHYCSMRRSRATSFSVIWTQMTQKWEQLHRKPMRWASSCRTKRTVPHKLCRTDSRRLIRQHWQSLLRMIETAIQTSLHSCSWLTRRESPTRSWSWSMMSFQISVNQALISLSHDSSTYWSPLVRKPTNQM